MNAIQPLSEFSNVEWLFHNACNIELFVFLLIESTGIGGQNHDISYKSPFSQPFRQIKAGNTMHLVIGDDEVERNRRLVAQFQRRIAIVGKRGMMTSQSQNDSKGSSGPELVINDQDVQVLGR